MVTLLLFHLLLFPSFLSFFKKKIKIKNATVLKKTMQNYRMWMCYTVLCSKCTYFRLTVGGKHAKSIVRVAVYQLTLSEWNLIEIIDILIRFFFSMFPQLNMSTNSNLAKCLCYHVDYIIIMKLQCKYNYVYIYMYMLCVHLKKKTL